MPEDTPAVPSPPEEPTPPDTPEERVEEFHKLVARGEMWVGKTPIPPPSYLKELEEVIPGAAARLFHDYERQRDHRHKMETMVVEGGLKVQLRGQVCAVIVSIAVLAAAVACVALGSVLVGGILSGLDVVGLVTIFVYGRSRQAHEVEEKRKQGQ